MTSGPYPVASGVPVVPNTQTESPASPGAAAAKGLSDEERLALALNRRHASLVKEVYDIALRQTAFETGRQARLDAKATSLLTAAGLSLTLAFTFGAQWLGPRFNFLWTESKPFYFGIVGCYSVGVLFGLVAAARAISALKVRTDRKPSFVWTVVAKLFQLEEPGFYRTIDEDVVFGTALLEADKFSEDSAKALARYQQTIAQHMWENACCAADVHKQKAAIIETGQHLFLGFLLFMIPLAIQLVLAPSPAAPPVLQVNATPGQPTVLQVAPASSR